MTNPKLIKSLAIAYPTADQNYPYLVSILKQLGRQPEFPNVPNYLRLWARINAGQLLGEDVGQWQPLLENETARLRKISHQYQTEKALIDARIEAINQRRQALESEITRLNQQIRPS